MTNETRARYLEEDTEPRLEPILNPPGFKLRLAYWYNRWQMGTVITPLKVIYARFPEGLGLAKKLQDVQQQLTIPARLKHLIKIYVATLNGCLFCIDIGKANAKIHNVESQVFDDLMRCEESEQFTDAEKAALAYVDEATRHKHVENSTFDRLQRHFTDREIVQITLLNAIENFYNLTTAPLKINSDELCTLWESREAP